jgi:hypothetical protein
VIATAVLRARRAGALPGGRQPTRRELDLIERAIEDSNNAASAALFAELGSADEATHAMDRVLRSAGDHRTEVNPDVTRPGYSSYGQTRWALGAEARFYRAMLNGCLLGRDDTKTIRQAMGSVSDIGGAGWGLGALGFPRLRFKAGWGPEQGDGSYTAIQFGSVGSARSDGYVIGIVAETGGSAAEAYSRATTVARRLKRALEHRQPISGPPVCPSST